MKRFTLFVLTLALALILATPALALGAQAPTPVAASGTFSLVGKITAIDTAAQTVTVKVLRGNILVKPYINQELTIQTTAKTRFLYTDGTTTTVITFADLKVGNPVSVTGKLAKGIWTAGRMTVGAKLICLP